MLLEALMNSFEEFYKFFGGSTTLSWIVRDKIFLVISNLYFFNMFRGMQVNFGAALHPILMPFIDVFPIRAAATQHGKYLTEKFDLNI
jgi:hypothetical protein